MTNNKKKKFRQWWENIETTEELIKPVDKIFSTFCVDKSI